MGSEMCIRDRVPLLAAIAAVVLLLQWMRDGSWVWPAILAVVLIVAGVV